MSSESTVLAQIKLPAIEGAEEIEFCATVAAWENPRPTKWRWLQPLIDALTRLTRPTQLRAHIIRQIRMAGLPIRTLDPAASALGEGSSVRVELPGPPESKEPCLMAVAALSPVQHVPEFGCGCAFCKGYWCGSLGVRSTARERHKMGFTRN